MSANLLPAIGYVVAALATGLAVYYWNRSRGLYSLLIEGANRYEELRERARQLNEAGSKLEERLAQHRETIKRLEKGIDDARAKSSDLLRQLEAKEHETRVVTEKLTLQRTHLERQVQKLEAQVEAQTASYRALEERYAALAKETDDRLAGARTEIEKLQAEVKRQQLDFDREKKDLEKRLQDGDPVEFRKMKRKVHQYDRLYQSMKGLKEMAEERAHNWEIALRKLSCWILKENGARADVAMPIGPLVGAALQRIGAQIIDDAEVFSEPRETRGAVRADGMDDDVSDVALAEGDGAATLAAAAAQELGD